MKAAVTNGCCTKETPCGLGDGDCDKDEHCAKGLKCGVDNCGKGFKYTYDCCYKRKFI